jgi:The ARF-like 2 binding protein BART
MTATPTDTPSQQNQEEVPEWLFETLLQFFHSPLWKSPILTWMDEKCLTFDQDQENHLQYTELHNEFREMVENLL